LLAGKGIFLLAIAIDLSECGGRTSTEFELAAMSVGVCGSVYIDSRFLLRLNEEYFSHRGIILKLVVLNSKSTSTFVSNGKQLRITLSI
jgi:hypothetical protein